MSDNKFKLQINIFGDFSSIQPDMKTISNLTKNLSDFNFLPQYFQENSLTIKNVEGNVVDELPSPDFSSIKRLRLSSIDEKYIIEFSSKIISINVTARKEINKLEDEISKIISVSLGNLLSSRVGVIIINERNYISKTVKPSISYYDELDEFDIRLNRRKKININNVEQLSNVIINVSKPFNFNNDDQNKLVQYVCDINTAPENTELRFSSDDVISFVKEAMNQGSSMHEILRGD